MLSSFHFTLSKLFNFGGNDTDFRSTETTACAGTGENSKASLSCVCLWSEEWTLMFLWTKPPWRSSTTALTVVHCLVAARLCPTAACFSHDLFQHLLGAFLDSCLSFPLGLVQDQAYLAFSPLLNWLFSTCPFCFIATILYRLLTVF